MILQTHLTIIPNRFGLIALQEAIRITKTHYGKEWRIIEPERIRWLEEGKEETTGYQTARKTPVLENITRNGISDKLRSHRLEVAVVFDRARTTPLPLPGVADTVSFLPLLRAKQRETWRRAKKRRERGEKERVGRRGKSRPLGMRNCETQIRETKVKRLRFQALTRDFARESLYNSAFARTRDAPYILREWHEREQRPYCARGKPTCIRHNTYTHSRLLSLHEIHSRQ